ncbi:hypothetical protein [Kribbella sp. CA-293567]|uniref:hypothetical protein n=1 Tax=Kribbella sp. CA-293567 TaxID=3002436 RepID=UPI0022DDEF5F|nr:hypothetical protein [Kribbella sp. CA-293567]
MPGTDYNAEAGVTTATTLAQLEFALGRLVVIAMTEQNRIGPLETAMTMWTSAGQAVGTAAEGLNRTSSELVSASWRSPSDSSLFEAASQRSVNSLRDAEGRISGGTGFGGQGGGVTTLLAPVIGNIRTAMTDIEQIKAEAEAQIQSARSIASSLFLDAQLSGVPPQQSEAEIADQYTDQIRPTVARAGQELNLLAAIYQSIGPRITAAAQGMRWDGPGGENAGSPGGPGAAAAAPGGAPAGAPAGGPAGGLAGGPAGGPVDAAAALAGSPAGSLADGAPGALAGAPGGLGGLPGGPGGAPGGLPGGAGEGLPGGAPGGVGGLPGGTGGLPGGPGGGPGGLGGSPGGPGGLPGGLGGLPGGPGGLPGLPGDLAGGTELSRISPGGLPALPVPPGGIPTPPPLPNTGLPVPPPAGLPPLLPINAGTSQPNPITNRPGLPPGSLPPLGKNGLGLPSRGGLDSGLINSLGRGGDLDLGKITGSQQTTPRLGDQLIPRVGDQTVAPNQAGVGRPPATPSSPFGTTAAGTGPGGAGAPPMMPPMAGAGAGAGGGRGTKPGAASIRPVNRRRKGQNDETPGVPVGLRGKAGRDLPGAFPMVPSASRRRRNDRDQPVETLQLLDEELWKVEEAEAAKAKKQVGRLAT